MDKIDTPTQTQTIDPFAPVIERLYLERKNNHREQFTLSWPEVQALCGRILEVEPELKGRMKTTFGVV